MNKQIFIVSLLICGMFASICTGEDCGGKAAKKQENQKEMAQMMPDIEKKIKQEFWYFLRNGQLSYQVNVNSKEKYLLSFVYENQVGTFLSYATINKEDKKLQIQAFLRIGNGPSDRQIPSQFEIMILSLRLQNKEYFIEKDSHGNYIMKGEPVDMMNGGQKSMKMMEEKEKMTEFQIKKKYEQFLEGAVEVNRQKIMTNQRVFLTLTYENKMGKFLALAYCDNGLKVRIEVFMRLGDGNASEKQYGEVLKPCILQLN